MSASNDPKPNPPGWESQIENLQDASREAFQRQDVETLRRLWAEEFMVNSPMGRVLDREKALELLAAGVIRHASYEERVEEIRRRGDVVVVMGHDVITDAPGGPPVVRRFTNIWAEADGTWRLIARHAHPTGKP